MSEEGEEGGRLSPITRPLRDLSYSCGRRDGPRSSWVVSPSADTNYLRQHQCHSVIVTGLCRVGLFYDMSGCESLSPR